MGGCLRRGQEGAELGRGGCHCGRKGKEDQPSSTPQIASSISSQHAPGRDGIVLIHQPVHLLPHLQQAPGKQAPLQ